MHTINMHLDTSHYNYSSTDTKYRIQWVKSIFMRLNYLTGGHFHLPDSSRIYRLKMLSIWSHNTNEMWRSKISSGKLHACTIWVTTENLVLQKAKYVSIVIAFRTTGNTTVWRYVYRQTKLPPLRKDATKVTFNLRTIKLHKKCL